MGALQQIETVAQEMINICQKERANKADKEKLLKLQGEMFANIENLTECEICGSITGLVVTMTINQVTGKLCKDCGMKALEAGKIQKPATRRRATRLRKRKKSAAIPPKAAPAAEEEPSLPKATTSTDDLYLEVEKATGLKKAEIKRLHKIIREIAGPMNLEHTLQYVQREAELAKLKIDQVTLGKAVELIMIA